MHTSQKDKVGRSKQRAVIFVLLGVAGLLLRGHYAGPFEEIVHSYAGNISVSFSVYFIALQVSSRFGSPKIVAAALALCAVELFEAFNGFGIMANVFDPIDFGANAVGVAVGFIIDFMLDHMKRIA
jgi:hypothetical protein